MPSSSRVLKWFWLAGLVGVWIVWGILASHRSQEATIASRWSPGFFAFFATWSLLTLAVTMLLWSRPRRWLRRHRGRCIGLGLGLLLALVATEVSLRVLDPLGLGYLSEMKRYIAMRQADETLVYTQPSQQNVRLDGVEVRFNGLGLRGAEIPAKADNERRVLFLGDSVVFGWGVEESDTFVQGLAERLSAGSDYDWRGINAGVCSYNSEQEELYLRERGLALAPDLVVLVFIDNDVLTYSEQWKAAESQARASLPRRLQGALKRTFTFQVASHALKNGLGGIQLTGAERRVQPGDAGWVANMEALTRLRTLCEQKGIPLACFHFRWRPNPWSDVLLHAAQEALSPTPLVDTSPWFQEGSLRSWVNSPTDSHPNVRAHARTSERMFASLQEQGLLRE